MLYLIPSPLGNIKDITLRTLEVLEKVEILLCEDTRVTGKLLDMLSIKNRPKLISYYQQVESQKISEVLGYLNKNMEVGLISDAGSPLVSDPGWLLVKTCINSKIAITSLPGPSALILALQLSGLPLDKFVFWGFLPKKMTERKKVLETNLGITKVAYESPERIKETVGLLPETAKVAVCRELTKLYETVIRGKKDEVLRRLQEEDAKGEVVLVWS